MQNSINKTKLTAIIAITLLMISAMATVLPAVFAQTTLPGYTAMPDRPTQTEVAASPDYVGVGQPVTINIMTYPAPSGPTHEAQSLVPELNAGFPNIEITIKQPNGSEETFKPIDETLEQTGIAEPGRAQIVGHLQFQYTPTTVGTYTLTASFPGEFYTTDNQYAPAKLSVYYKPSSSTQPETITVVEDEVLAGLLNGYPWSPLPEGYWENPVQTDNREWYAISGDWLQGGYNIENTNYNPYSTAPNSPHILWAKESGKAGLPGGFFGSLPYADSGSASIVMDGRIYKSGRSGYFECIDLLTGEKLWEAEGGVTAGARLDPAYQTETQANEGNIDQWIWRTTGGTWYRYDPWDGDLLQTITNVPRDFTSIKFQDGSSVVWCAQASLSTWNTTVPLKITYANLIKWDYNEMVTTVGYRQVRSNDWMDGVVWNVSIMTNDQESVGDNNFRGPIVFPYWEANVVVVKTPNAQQVMVGYDMTTGAFLWKNNATTQNLDVEARGVATSPSGPLLMQSGSEPEWVAYDVRTGNEIWRAPTGEIPWALLPAYTFVYNDGVHFLGSYDGHVYAYNKDTGQRVWQSDYLGEQWETIYGNQPMNGKSIGADGKLYYSTDTTYRMMPRTRFHVLTCIDETTGKFIWQLPIGIEPATITDGYLMGTDTENGFMYVIGKGKTETTVMAPLVAVSKGTGVLLTGSIMDMSPGKPNTPAVSDEDMSEWMDYLYGQNATLINNPPTPQGVPVKLAYQMADGSWKDINEVISDDHGNFGLQWTPPAEGVYKVMAFFLGSESYFGSSDTTYVIVGPAASPSGQIEPETGLISTEVAIALAVVAVAVIGAVAFLVIRKRK